MRTSYHVSCDGGRQAYGKGVLPVRRVRAMPGLPPVPDAIAKFVVRDREDGGRVQPNAPDSPRE